MTRRAAGSIRKRGDVWFLRYYVDGQRYEESSETGDERAARSLLAQRRREIADGSWKPPAQRERTRTLTVEAYLDGWIERREASGVRGVRNEAHYFDRYVKPKIGSVRLAALTRTQVRDLVAAVSGMKSERSGTVLAPRTVLHVYRTLSTALADAVLEEIIAASPCTLRTRKGELPRKRDKDPKWRASAVYTRDEAETMLASTAIAADRRALYALQLVAGLRGSEATGRRWRDLDVDAKPLGRLTVATQADGAESEHETKTGEIREVPVHPTLAAILEDWRRVGFPLAFGRHPRPEDPIVPSRQDPRGVSFRSATGAFEGLVADLEAAEVRRVPHARHAQRATFLSLLEVDGANMGIARRATHAAPSDVVGGYIRVQWADVCREIAKLQLTVKPRAVVLSIEPARVANGGSCGGSVAAVSSEPMISGPEGWALQDLKPARSRARRESGARTETKPRELDRDRRGKPPVAHVEVQTGALPPSADDPIAKLRALGFHDAADALELDRSGGGRKGAEPDRLAAPWADDGDTQ